MDSLAISSIHRDLSWLQFNDRVLNEARDPSNPLLERLKFLAISSTNLDEFFQIRFASLSRTIATSQRQGDEERSRNLENVRESILREVRNLRTKQEKLLKNLAQELSAQGFALDLKPKASSEIGKKVFQDVLFPLCTPPEAFAPVKLKTLGNLSMAVIFPSGVWFQVPRSQPHALVTQGPDGKNHLFFLDQLLLAHLGGAFNLEGEPCILRLTRDGDIAIEFEEEDTESIPDFVRKELVSRDRGKAVRLQHAGSVSADFLDSAARALGLSMEQVFEAPGTLSLQGVWSVLSQLSDEQRADPKLFFAPIKQVIPKILTKKAPVFEVLDQRDILLHHPYDSFDAFVNFIHKACEDPAVESIQMTVYRTDAVSPIIALLKKAAKTRRIRVFIELRARFDELNNLRLAEDLRKSGVEVVFGFGRLKLHAKIALVERRVGEAIRYYTHLSTGNYNALTARQYTDLAVLTANSEIGEDARGFFDAVAMGQVPSHFKKLVSAPGRLHRRIQNYIEAETKAALEGKPARIFAKVNALVDEAVISSLYRASAAGVKVDLVVRGACSLIPGIKGVSENIRVISIVDRFLEHSRIYYFEGSGALYLSSADWMPRNFFSRLEIAFPILDERIFRYIRETVIPTYFADTAKARELASNRTWRQRSQTAEQTAQRSQQVFQMLAEKEYKGTALE